MNIYSNQYNSEIINRINQLTPETKPDWGKMTVDQMLAHLNVAYDMSFTDKYSKPNGFTKFLLKLLVKKSVVGPKPYPKNSRTAPAFIISEKRNFAEEKKKLIDYINKVEALGKQKMEGKDSHSFGPLTSDEWNVLFGKHIEHHLTQFGV